MKKIWAVGICIVIAILYVCINGVVLADTSVNVIRLPEGEIPQFVPSKENSTKSAIQEPNFQEKTAPVQQTIRLHGYDAVSEEYQYVYFGKFEQSREGQPILWRVLTVEGNDALLLSEKILTTMPFGFSNEWEQSQIKKWLNAAFMMEAFSANERKAIYSSDTLGSVFILSQLELRNSEYGFSRKEEGNDKQRCAKGTTLAIEEGLFVNDDNQCSTYFTRTTPNSKNLMSVTSEGAFGVVKPGRDDIGVRPAMWVNLKEITFSEGDGTIQYPYQ